MKKQIRKTKEQLIRENELKAKVKELRAKIKNELYPYLSENTKNVEEAKTLCSIFASDIRNIFQEKAKDYTIGNVGLLEYVEEAQKKGEVFNADRYKALIEMFKDFQIMDGAQLIESFGSEIERWIRKENNQRSLKDLQTDFIDD